ncbi:MAG: DUF3306 domain-containing protein [Burkholderiaceae bacterium]
MSRDGEGDFWSRRRAAVRRERDRVEAEREAGAIAERTASLEQKTDDEILQELGLPDPDVLNEGDDFKPFMQRVVPERLRRRALRRLWSVNPVLANLDGLVDYGEDFTDAATVIPDLRTTYLVGKGMLEHVTRMAEQERAAAQAASHSAGLTPGVDDPAAEMPAAGAPAGGGPGDGMRADGSPADATADATAGEAAAVPELQSGEPVNGPAVAAESVANAGQTTQVRLTIGVEPMHTAVRGNFADGFLDDEIIGIRDAEPGSADPQVQPPVRRRMRFS